MEKKVRESRRIGRGVYTLKWMKEEVKRVEKEGRETM